MMISYLSLKPYVVTPHLNQLIEMVQMRGHKTFMQNKQKISLIIIKYSLLFTALHMPFFFSILSMM